MTQVHSPSALTVRLSEHHLKCVLADMQCPRGHQIPMQAVRYAISELSGERSMPNLKIRLELSFDMLLGLIWGFLPSHNAQHIYGLVV